MADPKLPNEILPTSTINTHISTEISRLKQEIEKRQIVDITKSTIPEDTREFEMELAMYEFLKRKFVDGN